VPYERRASKHRALISVILGTVFLLPSTVFHLVAYLFGTSAGGRTSVHRVAPGRIENLIGLALAAGTIVILGGAVLVVSLRDRKNPDPPRTARRLGIAYVVAALVVVLLTGRLS
jgi:hypothetical protein